MVALHTAFLPHNSKFIAKFWCKCSWMIDTEQCMVPHQELAWSLTQQWSEVGFWKWLACDVTDSWMDWFILQIHSHQLLYPNTLSWSWWTRSSEMPRQNKSLFLKFYLSGICDQDVESSTLFLLPVSLFSAAAPCWIKFLLGKYNSQFSLSPGYRIT